MRPFLSTRRTTLGFSAVLAPGDIMNLERPTMDGGCGQQPALFLGGTSGWSGISSPQQSAVQTASTPTENYGGPLSLSICISDSGHEILRPKPRRSCRRKMART